jgi:hypothetical protein
MTQLLTFFLPHHVVSLFTVMVFVDMMMNLVTMALAVDVVLVVVMTMLHHCANVL